MIKNLTELCNSKIDGLYKKNLTVYSTDDLAAKVIIDLEKSGRYEAVVKSERRVGLVTIRDMLKASQPDEVRLKELWTVTGYVTPDERVSDIVRRMVRIGVRAIPVVERDEVLGCFTQVDLCEALCGVEDLPSIMARELMKTPVTSLDINERVSVARSLMIKEGISNIPIVEYGRLIGIITAGIIVHSFITPFEKTMLKEITDEKSRRFPGIVGRVMDHHPFTTNGNDHWKKVACGLVEQRKSACIVIDGDGKVTGILTPREIMRPILALTTGVETPVYITGLESQESLGENLVKESILRLLKRTQGLHPHIEEVRISFERLKAFGVETRYKILTQAISASETYIVEAKGWDLSTTFKKLCEKLEEELKSAKKD
mgnify:CR=1 FL=1